MSEDNKGSRGIATHVPGIFQGLMANAIPGSLVFGVGWLYLHYFHHEAPKWIQGIGPSFSVAILALISLSVSGFRLIARRRANRTAAAKGDRIAILVARLGPDSDSEREAVINSIRVELGKYVEVIPAGVELVPTAGVSDDLALVKPTEEAHALLRRKHADLMIWGKTHRIDGKKRIELHFVAAEQPDEGGVLKVFGVTESLTLESGFGPELGLVLAAIAAKCALPALNPGKLLRTSCSRLPGGWSMSRRICQHPCWVRTGRPFSFRTQMFNERLGNNWETIFD